MRFVVAAICDQPLQGAKFACAVVSASSSHVITANVCEVFMVFLLRHVEALTPSWFWTFKAYPLHSESKGCWHSELPRVQLRQGQRFRDPRPGIVQDWGVVKSGEACHQPSPKHPKGPKNSRNRMVAKPWTSSSHDITLPLVVRKCHHVAAGLPRLDCYSEDGRIALCDEGVLDPENCAAWPQTKFEILKAQRNPIEDLQLQVALTSALQVSHSDRAGFCGVQVWRGLCLSLGVFTHCPG